MPNWQGGEVTQLFRSEFGTNLRDKGLSLSPIIEDKILLVAKSNMLSRYKTGTSSVFITIFFVLFSLAQAQSPCQGGRAGMQEIKALRVGDKVPEDFWTREHLFYLNGDTLRKSLAKDRGKVIVLNFWASWCGACKGWFSNNVRLERKCGDDIKILLVNSDLVFDNLEKIGNVLSTESLFEGEKGQSIIYDSYLKNLFPHEPIPNYVWIDHTERVRAVTNYAFVNSGQMDIMLRRKERRVQ